MLLQHMHVHKKAWWQWQYATLQHLSSISSNTQMYMSTLRRAAEGVDNTPQ